MIENLARVANILECKSVREKSSINDLCVKFLLVFHKYYIAVSMRIVLGYIRGYRLVPDCPAEEDVIDTCDCRDFCSVCAPITGEGSEDPK